MGEININWYLYWLGCAIGGIVLGFLISYLILNPIEVRAKPSPSPSIPLVVRQSPAPHSVTLLFTGDVMLGRTVGYNISKFKDASWPFQYVSQVMREADITYINLENPLISNCPLTQTGMKFCSETANVAGLVAAGVDIASLANNHTTNYGPSGLEETISTLTSNSILPVGLGYPVKITKNGQVFTFLSFTDIGPYSGVANVNPETLGATIKASKSEGEVLIVTFHWGHEYQTLPSQRQVSLAHDAIDAGADLIIGAHPHWVQTHETYKDKLIYYSLGNFVFDQEWSAETKKGLAVRLTYDGSSLVKTEELPVLIQNYGQPHWE